MLAMLRYACDAPVNIATEGFNAWIVLCNAPSNNRVRRGYDLGLQVPCYLIEVAIMTELSIY